MFRRHLGKIPRSDRPFDGLEERILPDALSAAENQSVIDLLLWPLNPMSQPVDDMGRRIAENVLGQGLDLLETRGWADRASGVVEILYSSSSSFLTAAICRSSNSVKRRPRHRSAARMSAPNMSLSTGFSPKPLGMIFSRRRSSTNSRSRRFVVLAKRRCVTGRRRCAMQASKSSSKQASALGRTLA